MVTVADEVDRADAVDARANLARDARDEIVWP